MAPTQKSSAASQLSSCKEMVEDKTVLKEAASELKEVDSKAVGLNAASKGVPSKQESPESPSSAVAASKPASAKTKRERKVASGAQDTSNLPKENVPSKEEAPFDKNAFLTRTGPFEEETPTQQAFAIKELLEGTRAENESAAAVWACNSFLLLGPSRSVRGLAEKFAMLDKSEVPTQSYDTLRDWSEKFSWKERELDYNERRLHEFVEARREVMQEDYAADYFRVAALTSLAAVLEGEIFEVGLPEERTIVAKCPHCTESFEVGTGEVVTTFPNLFKCDIKSTGQGEKQTISTSKRFDATLVNTYRAVLDDLAKEKGERKDNFAADVMSRIQVYRLPKEARRHLACGVPIADVLVTLIRDCCYSEEGHSRYNRAQIGR